MLTFTYYLYQMVQIYIYKLKASLNPLWSSQPKNQHDIYTDIPDFLYKIFNQNIYGQKYHFHEKDTASFNKKHIISLIVLLWNIYLGWVYCPVRN